MKDMDKAVERILEIIEKNEKILIYSDYDADGIPGAVVLYDFFKKIGYENFENYIPHRQNEGYGLNMKAIEKFSNEKVNLIITIDCGIKDKKEIEQAKKLGIEVIITDHHIVGEELPSAYAILNPKQDGCNYPDDRLAGAGVVFKLVQALIQKGSFEIKKGWEKWLIDMVGMATISDMVSLKGENRVYSYFGMQVLRKSPRYGLIHLLRKVKINQKNLNEDDLAFMITPRINAASRMGEPMRAFELLSSSDEVVAGNLAGYLDDINKKRKTLVSSMVREANKKLKERELREVIVIGNPKWNSGLSGLVASSLADKYQKSCFVWGREEDGKIKGSCRSCGMVNVVDLMNCVEDKIFTDIGGHKMAGGFSICSENIHLLEEKLNDAFKIVEKKGEKTSLAVDKKIILDDVNWDNYKIIEQLAPFGIDNQKPLFLIENVEIFNVRIFGKQNNHLGLDFRNSKKQKISAIQFFSESIKDGEARNIFGESGGYKKLERGQKVNILVNLEKSTFRNVNELRLRIVDFV